jgi:hypothetical protein
MTNIMEELFMEEAVSSGVGYMYKSSLVPITAFGKNQALSVSHEALGSASKTRNITIALKYCAPAKE